MNSSRATFFLRKLLLFLNMIRPSRTKTRVELLFALMAGAALIVSAALCLTVYNAICTFSDGYMSAVRGIFPQITISRRFSFSAIDPNDVPLIERMVRRRAGGAVLFRDVFLMGMDLSVSRSSAREGGETLFRTAFKSIDRDGINRSALSAILPREDMERIAAGSDAVAVSRDLFDNLEHEGVLSDAGGGRQVFRIRGGWGDVQEVEIVHVFPMTNGIIPRLMVGSPQILGFLSGGGEPSGMALPNRIAVEGIPESRVRAVYSRLQQDLEACEPLSDAEQLDRSSCPKMSYEVVSWWHTIPERMKTLLNYLYYIRYISVFVIIFPALIQAGVFFVHHVRERNTAVNLASLFGAEKSFLLLVLFFSGLLSAGVALFLGYLLYCIAAPFFLPGIHRLFLETILLDMARGTGLSPFCLGCFFFLAVFCGVLAVCPALRMLRRPAADSLGQ